jgi:hypothetical protein
MVFSPVGLLADFDFVSFDFDFDTTFRADKKLNNEVGVKPVFCLCVAALNENLVPYFVHGESQFTADISASLPFDVIALSDCLGYFDLLAVHVVRSCLVGCIGSCLLGAYTI